MNPFRSQQPLADTAALAQGNAALGGTMKK
jgi:hypothetical protein